MRLLNVAKMMSENSPGADRMTRMDPERSICARAHASGYVAEVIDLMQGVSASGEPRAVDPDTVARKLAIAADERKKGRTAEQAAAAVGWSRATLYRHQQNSSPQSPLAQDQ